MSNNPYRPGAAHAPPYLAGRSAERHEFSRILKQTPVLENFVLTGVRGIGKTVLMQEVLRKEAFANNWIWVSSAISESVSVSENNLVRRLLTDLNTFSGDWQYMTTERNPIGFTDSPERQTIAFNYATMMALFEHTPGLTSDKLKCVLLAAWRLMQQHAPNQKGIVFALDEAQNLHDRSEQGQYPLGVLLEVFSSLQSQGAPYILLLTGLPTLFPKLVESRTYAERMFRVVTLKNLSQDESNDAIFRPLQKESPEIKGAFDEIEEMIYRRTKGYPYFIQFWCRELYDYLTSTERSTKKHNEGVLDRITNKLDTDFFGARWAQLTDRQRDLLTVIAHLENSDGEFSVQEIAMKSAQLKQKFSTSHINQMLTTLFKKGLVFKERHGKYVLAVPLLDEYIQRRISDEKNAQNKVI